MILVYASTKHVNQDILFHQVNFTEKVRRLLVRRLSSKCGIFALGMEGLEYRNTGCYETSKTDSDPFAAVDTFAHAPTIWRCSSFDEKSEDSFCCKEPVDNDGGKTSHCKQLCCARTETERLSHPKSNPIIIQYKLQWIACEDMPHKAAHNDEYKETQYSLCLQKSRHIEAMIETIEELNEPY